MRQPFEISFENDTPTIVLPLETTAVNATKLAHPLPGAPEQPREGDLTPLEAVARQRHDRTDYQGQVTQDVYHEAGHPGAWNGPGWYARTVWTCRHSHFGQRGIEDAQVCARRKLARLAAEFGG